MNAAVSSPPWAAPVCIDTEALARIQAEFARGWNEIIIQAHQGSLQAPPTDGFRALHGRPTLYIY